MLENLLIKKMISAITAITINIPTPIPALKIPSIAEQLVSIIPITDNNATLVNNDFMISLFKLFIILCFTKFLI